MEGKTRREETQEGRERDGQVSGGKDGGGCEEEETLERWNVDLEI